MGIFKMVEPFRSWYNAQITHSQLPAWSAALGIIGEIVLGLCFVLLMLFANRHSAQFVTNLTRILSSILALVMLTAFYVHLHPNVPADVLPLHIKPPVIPAFFLLLSLANIYWAGKRKPSAKYILQKCD
jgi:ABC-type amino acid transport system permease subunit